MYHKNQKKNIHPKLPLELTFDGPDISSDGGFLPLRQADDYLGLTEAISALLVDRRARSRIIHARHEQIRQRVYQIALGYEDCNDADALRLDRMLKLACGSEDIEVDRLSSQPSLSRLENSVDGRSICQLYELLEDQYVQSLPADTQTIILDIDSTDDPVHGKQQMRMFHGYYGSHMYHPLLLFDGQTGQLVSVLLRPGNVHSNRGAVAIMERVISKIRARFAKAIILLRGDSGFCSPKILDMLEILDVDYIFGIARNSVLSRMLEPYLELAGNQFKITRQTTKIFSSFEYQAGSWSKQRHIIGKAEYLAKGPNPRFIITSLDGFDSQLIYHHYCQRGQCENYIKDFKNAIMADRLSCSRFLANCFRLILHAAAYNLMLAIRQKLKDIAPMLATMQIDTLRLKLFKVAAWLKQSKRRIWVRLPKSFPLAVVFSKLLDAFEPPGQLALS